MQQSLERSLLKRCYPPLPSPVATPPPRAPVLPFDGSAHTSAAEFHLAQLSRLLLPTLTTRVCMHAVLQTAGGGRRGGEGEGEGEGPRGEGGDDGGARRQHELAPTGETPTPQSSTNRLVPAGAHSSSSSSSTAEFGTGGGGTAAEGEGQGAGGQKQAVGLGGTGVADGGAVDMWTSLVDVLEVT